MREADSVGRHAPTARRVRLLREVLGYKTAKSFAEFLGFSEQRWGNVENGHPISSAVALRICQKVPGMTEDWLRHGRPEGLTYQLARDLAPESAGKASTLPSA